jgi:5-methylcytosine-specific restriction endonuclease McrA
MCEIRYPGICAGEASIADHIENIAALGIARRDATDPDTMQAACRPCHDQKTAAERQAGIQAHNERRRQRRRLPQPHPGD